jgi:type 1 glutamine amidotransferase
MQRREFLAAGSLAAWALAAGRLLAEEAPRRKVLFFTKSAGFEHSAIRRDGDQLSFAERVLTDLGKIRGFDVTCTKDGTVFDSDLSAYDAYFFYTTGDLTTAGKDGTPPMTAAGKQRLIDAVAGGKGMLGSHCASDTFHSPGERFEEQPADRRDPYIAMLGGEFIKHGPQQKARMVVTSPKFPGLADIEDFEMHEEWYSLKNFADDLHVILVQDTQGMQGSDYDRPPFPATWARRHGEGRVFYTSMGHREDVWTDSRFIAILMGGLNWACGDAEADLTPNLQQVAPGARVMPPKPAPNPS